MSLTPSTHHVWVCRVGLLLGLGATLLGCAQGVPADALIDDGVVKCPLPVFYREQAGLDYVSVVGDFNGWDRMRSPLRDQNEDGDYFRLLTLPPGQYAYRLYVDGREILDRTNPLRTLDLHGELASALTVPDCTDPQLRIAHHRAEDGHHHVEATVDNPPPLHTIQRVFGALGTDGIDGIVQGTLIGENPLTYGFDFRPTRKGKAGFTVHLQSTAFDLISPTVVTWNDARPFSWECSVVYQIMVDRYADENGHALPRQGARRYHGGHLDGITADIVDGRFGALGVDVLWVSPLNDNPEGLFLGRDGETAEAYHGYWVQSPRRVEDRFGGADALVRLVTAAHAAGLRVILDVVPNHLHESHPYVTRESGNPAWFNLPDGKCVCGITCPWGEYIRECWFDPFLPDLNWWNPAVQETMLADLQYWYRRFDLDGLRIDAVPMMPRNAVRQIRNALDAVVVGERPFLLGETFTGPNGHDQIRYGLGPTALSGQFDFPLMWGLRAFLRGELSGTALGTRLGAGQAAWNIPQVHMAPIVGNHDVPRLASVLNRSTDEHPTYERHYDDIEGRAARLAGLAWTFNVVQPGLPVLYAGDEYLVRGGHDPYNRAPLPEPTDLTEQQTVHSTLVARWNRFRQRSPALRHGEMTVLATDESAVTLSRSAPEETVIYHLSIADGPTDVTLPGLDFTVVLSAPTEARALESAPGTWRIPADSAHLFRRTEPIP